MQFRDSTAQEAVHLAKQARQGVAGNQPAVIHDADARAQRLDLFHVMAGVNDGRARAVDATNLLENMIARLRIDPRRRFVQEQQPGAMDEPHTQVEPTLHAPGKGADTVVGSIGQSYRCQDLVGAHGQLTRLHAIERAKKLQILAGRQLVVEGQLLRHHADRRA